MEFPLKKCFTALPGGVKANSHGLQPKAIYFGAFLVEFVSGTARAVRFFTGKTAPTPDGSRRSATKVDDIER